MPILFIYLFLTGFWLRFRWNRQIGTNRKVWDLLYVAFLFLTPVALGIWAFVEYGDRWTHYRLLLPFAALAVGFLAWAFLTSKRGHSDPNETTANPSASREPNGIGSNPKPKITKRRIATLIAAYFFVIVLISLGMIFDKKSNKGDVAQLAIPAGATFVLILASLLVQMRRSR
jgi:peptidoglycan/LPS O-acetylase OafA/YrhL